MGTLFNQPPRHRHDNEVPTLSECKDDLTELFGTKVTPEAAVALYRAEIELAKLRASISDRDVWDEQLNDLGVLFSEFNNIVREGLRDD